MAFALLLLTPPVRSADNVILPAPRLNGPVAVETALSQRRSVRDFATIPLNLDAIAQLLWAAQGTTSDDGLRTAPSAGARYPLEIYLLAGNVSGLPDGVYRYRSAEHDLVPVTKGDRRDATARAALDQSWMRNAPAMLIITADYSRTASKYRDRAPRYVHIEAGHAAQNVYLQAVALGLVTTAVGAFDDRLVRQGLSLPREHQPLLLLPLGFRR